MQYIIASLRMISLYKEKASQHFSSNRQIDISWLSSTIIFFLLIVAITILNGLLAQTSLRTYYFLGFNIIILLLLIFIITVLLKALQKPYFFSFSDEDNSIVRSSVPVQTTSTDSERIEKEKTAQIILNYMQSKKPYLEPELTLEQLATQLSLKPRMLSQTINEILGQNFYDFINRYRIEEAARLLPIPKTKKLRFLKYCMK